MGPSLQPLNILQRRAIIKNSQLIDQVLVQWEDMREEDNSWEDVAYLAQHFPPFILEDKDVLNEMGKGGGGGGNVVKSGESAEISLAPNELNRRRHVRGSMDADRDKLLSWNHLYR